MMDAAQNVPVSGTVLALMNDGKELSNSTKSVEVVKSIFFKVTDLCLLSNINHSVKYNVMLLHVNKFW
jgi:hypothetical protein